MSTPADVENANEAAARAQRQIVGLITVLLPMNLGPQGQTYGTETMSREDRILATMTDMQSGAIDFLGTVNKQAQQDLLRQFVADALASPVMRAGPAGRLATTIQGSW